MSSWIDGLPRYAADEPFFRGRRWRKRGEMTVYKWGEQLADGYVRLLHYAGGADLVIPESKIETVPFLSELSLGDEVTCLHLVGQERVQILDLCEPYWARVQGEGEPRTTHIWWLSHHEAKPNRPRQLSLFT